MLDARIEWRWFILCQIAFGLVAGLVVSRSERIHTFQHLPFAVRMGIEAPGVIGAQRSGNEPRRRVCGVAVASRDCGLLAGCDSLARQAQRIRPADRSIQVKDFAALYGENCAGCHGADGRFGAASRLANPIYQALVDDATLSRIVAGEWPAPRCRRLRKAPGGS